LSYFNQTDHELIDRASADVKQFLVDIARGRINSSAGASNSKSANEWSQALSAAGIPAPDNSSIKFLDQEIELVWRSHFVAASSVPLSEAARGAAEAKGWTIYELPKSAAAGVPAELISILKG
jgi:hypothetical protein